MMSILHKVILPPHTESRERYGQMQQLDLLKPAEMTTWQQIQEKSHRLKLVVISSLMFLSVSPAVVSLSTFQYDSPTFCLPVKCKSLFRFWT